MGNPAKPTNLRVIEGNPGKRAIPENVPKPAPVRPPCPGWICPTAKSEWDRIVPELEKVGLVSKIDRTALIGYVQCYANYVKAQKYVNEHGFSKLGSKTTIPEYRVVAQMLQQIRLYCQEFGMTPSARARMVVPGAKDGVDPFDEYD